jgi:ATP:ADP antiporter, AAA family
MTPRKPAAFASLDRYLRERAGSRTGPMSLVAIRPEERRDAWAAFLTLFGFVGSHAVLETARDALFLAKVPASRLPFVVLGIAVAALLTMHLQARFAAKLAGRRALSAWMLAAAVVSFGFFELIGRLGRYGLYALYVWSGVLTTLVLVHFWTLVGGAFSVTQARRLFGFIGAGSVLGAIVGSGVAGTLSRIMPAETLLLVAAGGFALAAAAPALFQSPTAPEIRKEAQPSTLRDWAYVREHPYARGIAAALLAASICLTLGDFLFKSTVAAHIPREQLGVFFGTFYFASNLLSLAAQLVLVPWLLKRFSLAVSFAILPASLLVAGAGLALTGGLAFVLVTRTADGAFRHSLHRTAAELLVLPFGDEARRRVKAFTEVASQRGGQILASLLVLGLGVLRASPRVIGAVLVLLAAGWLAMALALRAPYLNIFRARLKAGRLPHLDEFPDLDAASLATLLRALDSDQDNQVLAALSVLERENKVDLIPALTLFHPSPEVVESALTIFTRARRTSVVPVIDRVLEHASPRVRAASIAARSVLMPDSQQLRRRLREEDSDEVKAAIVVNLIAAGEMRGADAAAWLDDLLKQGRVPTQIALCEAIALREAAAFEPVLMTLSKAEAPTVRAAAINAMGRVRTAGFLDPIVEALAEEATRRSAQEAVAAYGEQGLAALQKVLTNPTRPLALRRRIPRAMTFHDAEPATTALLDWLTSEPDTTVRYQVIRALQHLTRSTTLSSLHRSRLRAAIEHALGEAFRHLDERILLTSQAPEPWRTHPGHELLDSLLRQLEQNATERLFLLLGLLHPKEDFAQIYRGLRQTKDIRATSVELLENILSEPLRSAVLGLVDDAGDTERRRRAGRYHAPLRLGYEALLAHLLASDSEAIQDLTTFLVGELGLTSLRSHVEAVPNPEGTRVDITLALARLLQFERREVAT